MAETIRDVQSKAVVTSATALCPAFATNPATGDTIVVLQAAFNGTAPVHQAPTVSAGTATFTQIGTTLVVPLSATTNISMWRAENITGGVSMAVTGHCSGSVGDLSVVAWCLTGANTPTSYNADTVGPTGNGTANPATGNTSGSPPANSIWIGELTDDGANADATDGTGWNTTGSNGFTSTMQGNARLTDNASFQALYTEYKLASAVQSATWTNATNTHWAARAASFAPAAAGGPTTAQEIPALVQELSGQMIGQMWQ